MKRLVLSLLVVLTFASGCVVPEGEGGPGFDVGGERPPEAAEVPYWGIDDCLPGELGSAGPGAMTLPWRLEDAWGRDVRLHDFCGRAIFIEVIEANVPDIQERLVELEVLRSSFNHWELAVVVLIAHRDGRGVDAAMLRSMSEDLGLRFPILSDPEWAVTLRYTGDIPDGRSVQLYSPGLNLEATGLRSADATDIEALLDEGVIL